MYIDMTGVSLAILDGIAAKMGPSRFTMEPLLWLTVATENSIESPGLMPRAEKGIAISMESPIATALGIDSTYDQPDGPDSYMATSSEPGPTNISARRVAAKPSGMPGAAV